MDVVKMDMDTSNNNNNNKLTTILFLAALSTIILLPVLQTKAYAFDFGNETCITDASSAFTDGYRGAQAHGTQELARRTSD